MPGHYVATATAALWVAVTPQTITTPAPSFDYVGAPGSVQSQAYRTSKPVPLCHIRDDKGRVVGFSLSCKGSEK